MSLKTLLRTSTATISGLILWLPMSVLAAEPAASVPASEADAIVVTAQKREELLADVPAAVQAISGAELERRGILDVRDAIRLVPGASLSSTVAPGFDTYQIRGVSSGTQGDATVGFYLDDLAFSIPNVQISPGARLFDLERIEVLRGPQGTLYGQGSMGGTIKVLTAQPDLDDFEMKAQAVVASVKGGEASYSGDVAVNIPIVEGRVALRLVGGYDKTGGVAESPDFPAERNIDGSISKQFRAKLTAEVTDRFEVRASYWRTSIDQDFQRAYTTSKPPVIAGTGGQRGYFRTDWSVTALALEYDLGFATLDSGTSYLKQESSLRVGFPFGGAAGSNDTVLDAENFTEELRLVSGSPGPLKWIGGVFLGRAKIDSVTDLKLPIPGFVSTNAALIKTRTFAVFGEISYELFGGRVTPLFGLRRFHEKRDLNQSLVSGDGTATPPEISETFESWNPRFNIAVRPTENGQIYLNIAKGYRGGAVQPLASVAAAGVFGIGTDAALPSDHLWSYELGGKWTSLGGDVYVEAAVYATDWSDAILQFVLPTSNAVLINAGDIKGYGTDLSGTWRTPLPGLRAQVSTNYNETTFHNPPASAVASSASVRKGAQIPGVPRWTAAVSLDYRSAPQNNGLQWLANLSYSFRSSQIGDTNGLKSENQQDLSLRVGASHGDWSLAVFANNITDRRGPVGYRGFNELTQTPMTIGISISTSLTR